MNEVFKRRIIRQKRERASLRAKRGWATRHARMASEPPSMEDEFQRARRADRLLKIVTITDPRTGETNRLQVWNGHGARVNQVAISVNGKPWKTMGRKRLATALTKSIL